MKWSLLNKTLLIKLDNLLIKFLYALNKWGGGRKSLGRLRVEFMNIYSGGGGGGEEGGREDITVYP